MTGSGDLKADADAAAEAGARERRLETADNPNPRVDYMVLLDVPDGPDGTRIELRYVPDKLILNRAAFTTYLAGLAGSDARPGAPEPLALRVLADLNDELIPRWIQVAVTAPAADESAPPGHRVLVEDKQPKWENRELTARAGGI